MTVVLSSTEIEVSWEEVPAINQNGIITMYEVQYIPLETFGGEIYTLTANITNTSLLFIVLTGLEEYVEYNISVRAYTSAGPGPYSDGVVERTDTDRELGNNHMHKLVTSFFNTCTEPAAPPQNVTATAVSPTAIIVSWEDVPAIDQNGVITMYEIHFVPLETFGGQITSDTVNTSNGSVLMMVLTGLEEYVEYNISVRAYTSAGPGPYSVGVVERTDTDSELDQTLNIV